MNFKVENLQYLWELHQKYQPNANGGFTGSSDR